MGLGGLLEACQVHEKVALEHSSKSTKYELEGSYDDLVHELSWTYYTPFREFRFKRLGLGRLQEV